MHRSGIKYWAFLFLNEKNTKINNITAIPPTSNLLSKKNAKQLSYIILHHL